MPRPPDRTSRGAISAALARTVALAAGVIALLNPVAANTADVSLAERLDALVAAYPGAIRGWSGNRLELADGSALQIDDGRRKSLREKLIAPDIEDMLEQVYPVSDCAGDAPPPPPAGFDPGRRRPAALMAALYGHGRGEVETRLTTIDWFGQTLQVTTRYGIDEVLKRVVRSLARLPEDDLATVRPSAGAYNWRAIAGTDRLSVHSYGAAIDLNTRFADYWRWQGGRPGAVPSHRNRIPLAVVEAFEREGFIWGGRWYHFDTMHFEYRPELIAIGRLAASRGCIPPGRFRP